MRSLYLLLFILLFINKNVFSQNTITITGATVVNQGDQETYTASFNYANGPITWSVIGGVIVSPPTNTSCTVWWTTILVKGSVTATDANNNVSKKLMVLRPMELEFTCITANAGNDVSICAGGSAVIGTPSALGITYSWSPITGLSNPNIAQPTANPLATTNYTLTVATQNLLQNGDFELGNTGFTTGYLLHPNALYDGLHGRYTVTSSPALIDIWCDVPDHTPNGTLMFLADGNSNQFNNPPAWSETVAVTPNTDYDFSGFALSVFSPSSPIIEVRINNTVVLNNFIPTVNNNNNCATFAWSGFNATTWNSGSSTSAVIEIRTTSWDKVGNDFALDDLKFSVHCLQTTDQVTVGVSTQIPSVTPAGPITYYNQYESPQQVVLTSTPAGGYQWYKNNVAIPGANSQTYAVTLDGFGVSTDYYKCENACGSSNTVTINYNGCNSGNYTTCYPVPIPWGPSCAGTIISQGLQLPALPSLGGGTLHQWWTYSTSSCFNISPTGFLTQTSGFGTWCVDGIYTKASRNGVEKYMYYVFGTNPGCRTMNSGNDPNQAFIDDNTQKQKASIFPNPASTQITITAPGGIDIIEIYNELGVLIRKQKNNGSDKLVLSTATLANGIYVCRITGKNGQETVRFLVRRQ